MAEERKTDLSKWRSAPDNCHILQSCIGAMRARAKTRSAKRIAAISDQISFCRQQTMFASDLIEHLLHMGKTPKRKSGSFICVRVENFALVWTVLQRILIPAGWKSFLLVHKRAKQWNYWSVFALEAYEADAFPKDVNWRIVGFYWAAPTEIFDTELRCMKKGISVGC